MKPPKYSKEREELSLDLRLSLNLFPSLMVKNKVITAVYKCKGKQQLVVHAGFNNLSSETKVLLGCFMLTSDCGLVAHVITQNAIWQWFCDFWPEMR